MESTRCWLILIRHLRLCCTPFICLTTEISAADCWNCTIRVTMSCIVPPCLVMSLPIGMRRPSPGYSMKAGLNHRTSSPLPESGVGLYYPAMQFRIAGRTRGYYSSLGLQKPGCSGRRARCPSRSRLSRSFVPRSAYSPGRCKYRRDI
jgi:hypothetical protein